MSEPDKAILAQADKYARTCADLRDKRQKIAELEEKMEWGGLLHFLWKARGGDVDKAYPLNFTVVQYNYQKDIPKGEGYFCLINGDKKRCWPVKIKSDFNGQHIIDMWDDGEIPERLIEIVLTKMGEKSIHRLRKSRLEHEAKTGKRRSGSSLEFVREKRSESGVWTECAAGDDGLPEVAEGTTSESA